MEQRRHIGTIIRPHGISGALFVALSNELEVPAGSQVWIGYSNTFARPYILESFLHASSDSAIIRLKGIVSRDQAEQFREQGLFVEAQSLRTPTEKVSSMEGWQVRTLTGELVGTVLGIQENPAHPLLTVAMPDGEVVLIPHVEVFIINADPTTRIITVSVPDGLFSIQRGSSDLQSGKRKRQAK